MGNKSIFLASIVISFLLWPLVASNIFIYAQNESSQGTPSGENPAESNLLKIRCSNGSLVDRASECPSSDECPSPNPSGNDTLECTSNLVGSGIVNNGGSITNGTRNSNNSSQNEAGNTGQFQVLTITTEKKSYKPGEIVNFIVKNSGTEPLTFPNSILGLNVENALTHEKYPIFSAQVITALDSGGQKSLKWDQKNSSGQQVQEGNYTASVSTGPLTANVRFAIMK